ncbi:MAG TPA: condensation domain-containing protein, partial [Gemmatimonadaceae bacterium]
MDHDALRAAVAALVDRHESLRTAFALTDEGLPVRRVLPAGSGPGLVERSVPPRSLDAFLDAEAGRPFDLSGGPPPFRATLVECGDRAWVLQLCMHHIVTDGWSIEVILRDLGELYRAHRAGRAPSLPALRIGYGAYAEWQRRRLTGELLARNVEYWRRRLADAPAVLDLPTDRPRGAVQTDEGARHPFKIPARLVEAVTALSRRHGVTPYMTMLAAWQTLLRRYSGQSRVVVGSPVAGRVRAELEPVVGLFINMLPMDTDVSGNPSFVELLARVREGCLSAYAHDELPFDKLVDELNVERTLAHHPVFQVAFVLQNAPPASLVLEGATTRPVPGHLRAAIFDLGLFVVAEGRGWTANIDYRADLFDAATVRRMAAHLERLLEEIVARPETRIDRLRILAAEERDSLVATVPWHEAPKDACLHDTFEAQAAKTPEAVALVSGDEQLTYRELDERADALAAGLRRLGVGPEEAVAVCLERSPAWVVAMLGVLKAGGIYVPIA